MILKFLEYLGFSQCRTKGFLEVPEVLEILNIFNFFLTFPDFVDSLKISYKFLLKIDENLMIKIFPFEQQKASEESV